MATFFFLNSVSLCWMLCALHFVIEHILSSTQGADKELRGHGIAPANLVKKDLILPGDNLLMYNPLEIVIIIFISINFYLLFLPLFI